MRLIALCARDQRSELAPTENGNPTTSPSRRAADRGATMIPRGTDAVEADGLFLHAFADESLDGLSAVDRELRFVYWNPAMAQLSGVGAAEVLGRRAADLPGLAVTAGGDDPFRRALLGEAVSLRDQLFLADGGDRRAFYDVRYH